MPTAVKDGYRFEGWYAWTDAGVVQEKELAELTGLPVRAGNDANVAALGEMWMGNIRSRQSFWKTGNPKDTRHPVLHFTRSGTRFGSRS